MSCQGCGFSGALSGPSSACGGTFRGVMVPRASKGQGRESAPELNRMGAGIGGPGALLDVDLEQTFEQPGAAEGAPYRDPLREDWHLPARSE